VSSSLIMNAANRVPLPNLTSADNLRIILQSHSLIAHAQTRPAYGANIMLRGAA
jgi:hypothetical protein